MNRRARLTVLSLAVVFWLGKPGAAQIVIQPTPLPVLTAENEPWYLKGDPITYAGNFYYPSGAQVFFNPNEMVRSGFYMGIPLYTRTTLEPYSIVYVPLAGGRMQPYERPRSGELAGTSGSTPTGLPTSMEPVPGGLSPQAAGPLSQTAQVIPVQIPTPVETIAAGETPESPRAVGTTGRASPPWRPMHTRIGGTPQGTNSIFIEFRNRRWYPAGPAQIVDTSRMVRIDDYKGFDVWQAGVDESVIYIPVTRGGSLAVAYTRTRPQ